MEFTFDPEKDVLNIKNHGISLDQAHLVFNDPQKLTLQSHRFDEDRLLDICFVALHQAVFVLAYVFRGRHMVRSISLRKASKQERVRYANEI
jgi:uncharacterized DUF497 family protein